MQWTCLQEYFQNIEGKAFEVNASNYSFITINFFLKDTFIKQENNQIKRYQKYQCFPLLDLII